MRGDNPLVHRIAVKDRDGRVIGEKEVVAYRGLLDMVHKERVRAIKTRLLQAPYDDNAMTAIVHATVITARGTFTGIGDANPRNVNSKIVPHLIRMAETRAEARAMRKSINIGVVSMEELGDDLADDVTYEGTVVPLTPRRAPANDNAVDATKPQATSNDATAESTYAASPVPTIAQPAPPAPTRSFSDGRASDQQRRFLFRLLFERNITGDAAREFIHRELGVESVQNASWAAVSALIDRVKQNGHAAEGG